MVHQLLAGLAVLLVLLVAAPAGATSPPPSANAWIFLDAGATADQIDAIARSLQQARYVAAFSQLDIETTRALVNRLHGSPNPSVGGSFAIVLRRGGERSLHQDFRDEPGLGNIDTRQEQDRLKDGGPCRPGGYPIEAFLAVDATAAQIQQLTAELRADRDVRQATFVPVSEAVNILLCAYRDDPAVTRDALRGITPASFRITVRSGASVAQVGQRIAALPGVATVASPRAPRTSGAV